MIFKYFYFLEKWGQERLTVGVTKRTDDLQLRMTQINEICICWDWLMSSPKVSLS